MGHGSPVAQGLDLARTGPARGLGHGLEVPGPKRARARALGATKHVFLGCVKFLPPTPFSGGKVKKMDSGQDEDSVAGGKKIGNLECIYVPCRSVPLGRSDSRFSVSESTLGILVAFWDFSAGGKNLRSYAEDGNSPGRCRGPPGEAGILELMYREAFPAM